MSAFPMLTQPVLQRLVEELDLPHDFITAPAVPVDAVNEGLIVVEDVVDESDEGIHAPPVGNFPGGYTHGRPLPLLPLIRSTAAGAV